MQIQCIQHAYAVRSHGRRSALMDFSSWLEAELLLHATAHASYFVTGDIIIHARRAIIGAESGWRGQGRAFNHVQWPTDPESHRLVLLV